MNRREHWANWIYMIISVGVVITKPKLGLSRFGL